MVRPAVGFGRATCRVGKGKALGIRELAKHLNISIGTVSRALNGHKEVNEETRQRVLEAAEQLGYAPNQSGRSLRQGSINTIAFMLSSERMGEQDALFFMEVCHGVQTTLARHGLDLVIHLSRPGDDPLERVRRVVERRLADALILPETRRNDDRLDYLARRGFPFATLGRSRSGGEHPWLDLDFEGAMRQSVARLVGLGHRHIALATGEPGLMLDHVLRETYRHEVCSHGLTFDETLMMSASADEDGGYATTDRLLAQAKRPTAIIFPHHRSVAGAYKRLAAEGLRPGADMAILSCSPDSPTAQYLSPALTCFRLSFEDLGKRLGLAVLGVMPQRSGFPGDLIQEIWPWEMVERGSDCAPSAP